MANTLRVGIIGASAERGWAKISHVPAIQQLDGIELDAVVTRVQASADKAVKAFGAKKGYGDAKALFADPDVDIVTVAVNVPAHRDLILGALAAGKHVYCEYPLGRDRTEAEELAKAARKAGVHVAIGLQLRSNPAARRAREMIEAGTIGRVLSARILSTTMAFGHATERAMAFAEKPENGVTLVSIQGAHTIDIATAVLGDFADLSALMSTQSALADGAPVSIEVANGRSADATPFRFEVVGQTGTMLLEGGAPRGVQSGLMRLTVNGEEQHVDAGPVGYPETAANIAGLYAALRNDIIDGTRATPDFDQAVRMARLVDAVLSSSKTGERNQASEWS